MTLLMGSIVDLTADPIAVLRQSLSQEDAEALDLNPRKLRVYIAGPYTKPDPETNTAEAIFMGDWVRSLGYDVYIPHLTHFWEKQIHHEWEFWMEHDLAWLALCDILLRLPGESAGADREVEFAQAHGIRVVYSINDLLAKGSD